MIWPFLLDGSFRGFKTCTKVIIGKSARPFGHNPEALRGGYFSPFPHWKEPVGRRRAASTAQAGSEMNRIDSNMIRIELYLTRNDTNEIRIDLYLSRIESCRSRNEPLANRIEIRRRPSNQSGFHRLMAGWSPGIHSGSGPSEKDDCEKRCPSVRKSTVLFWDCAARRP